MVPWEMKTMFSCEQQPLIRLENRRTIQQAKLNCVCSNAAILRKSKEKQILSHSTALQGRALDLKKKH